MGNPPIVLSLKMKVVIVPLSATRDNTDRRQLFILIIGRILNPRTVVILHTVLFE
jgi:hypothetical protein